MEYFNCQMAFHALFLCHIWQTLLLDINKMNYRVPCIKCYIRIDSLVFCLPVCRRSTRRTWPLLWVEMYFLGAWPGRSSSVLVWGWSSWHFWKFTLFLPCLSRNQTIGCIFFFFILPSPFFFIWHVKISSVVVRKSLYCSTPFVCTSELSVSKVKG